MRSHFRKNLIFFKKGKNLVKDYLSGHLKWVSGVRCQVSGRTHGRETVIPYRDRRLEFIRSATGLLQGESQKLSALLFSVQAVWLYS